MILQANLNHFNALVIGQSIQTLNNRLTVHYGKIKAIQRLKSFFLVSNEDFIDINSQSNSYFFVTYLIFRHVRQDFSVVTMRARMSFKIHCMGLNFKSSFLNDIKKENKEFKGIIKKEHGARIKQIPPISGIKLKDYFLSNLASFSRQVAITQAEKLVFSFLACSSICSIKSWGKRISLRFDLLVSLAILIIQISLVRTIYTKIKNKNSVDMYGQNKIYCADTLIFKILIKSIAQRVRTSIGYLTTNIKRSNAMANSNDTLRPENGQLDLSNLISVLNLYKSNIPTCYLLQAKNHFEELQQSILWGVGAIGNLMYWACESEDYTEQNLKNDMRDIGYLLTQLKDVAYFALNQINQLDAERSNKVVE
ncbi:hypothetical protein A9G11_03395 [Gilliamella sp. wkB108]|nr:hypothetical protein A9G11_03395 [Gilliamella apicola]